MICCSPRGAGRSTDEDPEDAQPRVRRDVARHSESRMAMCHVPCADGLKAEGNVLS